ncbi:MAG: type 2 isopentenyl-diphosphate Delta-isomerase [Anaerolineales bacterium]|nr:type 2 isopentenyl-diphosphate Delta-isomerase [Anaerolineales bacterium]
MKKVTPSVARKADHIRINLEKNVQSGVSTGLEKYRFSHQALPEINLADVVTQTSIFGRKLSAPLLVSSMTGGTKEAGVINRALAGAAQSAGVAMGLGSLRPAIETPAQASSYRVRDAAPDILLLSNLGAIQLNYGYSVDECRRAVDLVEADALILHLNSLQEALQPEGDTEFAGLLQKIETICRSLSVPVVVKEVGWGIGGETARRLAMAGVAAIDVAGAGGTSWSQVEKFRARNRGQARVAALFADWGLPTAEALVECRRAVPDLPLIASGGIRNGLEIAKCIALGASLAGVAGPLLPAAVQGARAVEAELDRWIRELRVTMFAAGARDLSELRELPLRKS